MRNFFQILLLILFTACNRSEDVIIASIFNNKLYLSEIKPFIPEDIRKEDSVALSERIIEEWLKEQILLHEANSVLSAKDRNFDKEIIEFKKSLLINAYYKKITSDSSQFIPTAEEINRFLQDNPLVTYEEKDIVKLNYVKVHHRSKVMKELKEILFDEEKRMRMKNRIEQLCADSIEYFIDENAWLWFDDIREEIPIAIEQEDELTEMPKTFEIREGNYSYLIVLVDFKRSTTKGNSDESISAQAILMQQKKKNFIDGRVEELYREHKGKAIR